MLNSIVYEVEFDDGVVNEYSANVIAQQMLDQVDDEGYYCLKSIVDYQRDDSVAISKEDGYITTKSGQRRLRKSTKGWKLLVRWADLSESWIPLKDLKESNPIEVAEFARARGISNKPAFAWWVPFTLRKRDAILSAVRVRARKNTHKYGIELPTSFAHADEIDWKSLRPFWCEALAQELKNVGIAFEVLPEGKSAPKNWNLTSGHIVWDVKMDFTRKVRWVLD